MISVEENKYREYSTFDAFPTTLAAMGIEIPGDRLGLGSNLFSKTPTLLEDYGLKHVKKELEKRSDFMISLGQIDKESAFIKKEEKKKEKRGEEKEGGGGAKQKNKRNAEEVMKNRQVAFKQYSL